MLARKGGRSNKGPLLRQHNGKILVTYNHSLLLLKDRAMEVFDSMDDYEVAGGRRSAAW